MKTATPRAAQPRTGLPPVHPGEILREDVIPALGKPISEIADLLQVTRQTLHGILAERVAISPTMAAKLGKLCGNGPEIWLNLQRRYDLATLPADVQAAIERIPTLEAVEG